MRHRRTYHLYDHGRRHPGSHHHGVLARAQWARQATEATAIEEEDGRPLAAMDEEEEEEEEEEDMELQHIASLERQNGA